MNALTKKTLRYFMLPQVAPRLHKLFGGGFSFMALLVAQIFASIRLLPDHHPYLNRTNKGRFSIRHAVFEAWRHLRFDWKHADQVLIFAVIILGLAILGMQLGLLALGVFAVGSAMALNMPAYFNNMFITPNPQNDIAFMVLDRVFGVPDLFNSCVAVGAPCFGGTRYNENNVIVDPVWPTPFHEGFHQFLSVYSYGLLVIAALVIAYYVTSIIMETAQTGTPFGKRFNRVWTPVRLVIALGLLIPTASGLNSGQYIVLYAAKFGSGFATNGWNMFLAGTGLTGGVTLLGAREDLVGRPANPPVNNLLDFATSLAACVQTQRFYHNRTIEPFIVNPYGLTPATMRLDLVTTANYITALEFMNYGDIHFVFGEYAEENGRPKHVGNPGYVKPYCGELVLQVTDVADAYSPGSLYILERWYNAVRQMIWAEVTATDAGSAGNIAVLAMRKYATGYDLHDPNTVVANTDIIETIRTDYETYVDAAITEGVNRQRNANTFDEMDDFGWAGAGIWYNKIAEMNGMVIGAANSLPAVRLYPEIMEKVRKERMKTDQDASGPDRYSPVRSDGTAINLNNSEYNEATILYAAFKIWGDTGSEVKPTGNIFTDVIHSILGTRGLYNMAENADIHPLAQLAATGKSLVESAIRNMGASFAAGVMGGAANLLNMHGLGTAATIVSQIAGKIALVTMTTGFLLFYVVPFLPFMYYFFALGVWVKTVLEAMVGVPVWALAHLHIDGDGIAGDSAMTGYILILEVFLRPICVVFGLLASVVIFGAQIKILHEIWFLVVSNVSGFDAGSKTLPAPEVTGGINYFRSILDQFFFTVIYAFLVYLMALSSFKLIDQVPDYIMRWMGSNASTFGDIYKDGDIEAMTTRAVLGVGAGMRAGMGAFGGLRDMTAKKGG